jgi:hypothetical protein
MLFAAYILYTDIFFIALKSAKNMYNKPRNFY